MNEKLNEKLNELLNETFNDSLEIKNLNWVDFLNNAKSMDKLPDMAVESICEHGVMYYYDAIDYLRENDPSFTNSLALATRFSYETSSLDSEILASLLIQENMKNELSGINLIELCERYNRLKLNQIDIF